MSSYTLPPELAGLSAESINQLIAFRDEVISPMTISWLVFTGACGFFHTTGFDPLGCLQVFNQYIRAMVCHLLDGQGNRVWIE